MTDALALPLTALVAISQLCSEQQVQAAARKGVTLHLVGAAYHEFQHVSGCVCVCWCCVSHARTSPLLHCSAAVVAATLSRLVTWLSPLARSEALCLPCSWRAAAVLLCCCACALAASLRARNATQVMRSTAMEELMHLMPGVASLHVVLVGPEMGAVAHTPQAYSTCEPETCPPCSAAGYTRRCSIYRCGRGPCARSAA
jgi:hypothetical protein